MGKSPSQIKHIHSDNGVLDVDMFRSNFQEKVQLKSFWSIGAQHQNYQSESNIQTIIYMACTVIIHVLLHLGDRGVDDISL